MSVAPWLAGFDRHAVLSVSDDGCIVYVYIHYVMRW
jgi:hypothetical protein